MKPHKLCYILTNTTYLNLQLLPRPRPRVLPRIRLLHAPLPDCRGSRGEPKSPGRLLGADPEWGALDHGEELWDDPVVII